MNQKHFVLALLPVFLSACGWVDSTGKQDNSLPALSDPTLVVLDNGDTFSMNENTEKFVVFDGTDNRLANWSWTRLDGQADIERCAIYADFDPNNALSSLQESCASGESCEVRIEETVSEEVTRFMLTTPQLRAPAALKYRLTAQANDGTNIEREQLLCAVPINDAPNAEDDRYSVLRGTTLIVEGDTQESLLFNDDDDDDIRNKPLRVITTAETQPRFAANFQLYADGGFLYEPSANAPLSSNGSVSDRFSYQVTDGIGFNTATVSIKITDFNSAPMLATDLPIVEAIIWDQEEDITYIDLLSYFTDAEDDTISFTILNNSLPESGSFYLTNEGLLRGNPDDDDSGRYFVRLAASDSIETVETGMYLDISRSNGVNKAPYASDIKNATVTDTFSYDITPFFEDADDDHMAFTATGLPANVEISSEGVISGTVTDQNRGRVLVRVTANDGNGGSNSDGFRLTLR